MILLVVLDGILCVGGGCGCAVAIVDVRNVGLTVIVVDSYPVGSADPGVWTLPSLVMLYVMMEYVVDLEMPSLNGEPLWMVHGEEDEGSMDALEEGSGVGYAGDEPNIRVVNILAVGIMVLVDP